VFPSYASALEKLKHPINISPSWDDDNPRWTFDADEDCVSDTASFSELGCQRKAAPAAAPPTTPTPSPQSKHYSASKPNPKFKPNGLTAAQSLNSSPSSLRTRAATSRLVSFFKKKE
jgi:hypothetical protein